MQNQAIQVKGLQKSYKQFHVLKGVDFEVEKGSIFALLGSNGAGKTTIVKILTTLLKQNSGTATVNGFDVAAKPESVRQSISLTGQFAAVDEILTGRENLIMIAKLRHLKNPRQAADDLLNRFSDMSIMLGRSMRHITRSMDTIITVTIMPIAFMLLFVYVFGGAIQTGTDNYVNYLLPGILLIAIASGIAYTAYRLFMDMQSGIFERFHTMPIARSAALWGHVLTSLVSNAISVVVIILVALIMGFRSSAGILSWLAVTGTLALFTMALTWIAVIAGLSAKSVDGAGAFSYPIIFLPFISSAFVPTASMPGPVRAFAENQPVTSIVDAIRSLLAGQPVSNDIWIALAWYVGITLIAYIFAMRAYKKRV